MSTILNKIIENKRVEIVNTKTFDKGLVKKSTRGFKNAITSSDINVIAEIKLGSPSEGVIIEKSKIPSVVSVYNKYARAISVVTDNKFFFGSFNLLGKVREMTNLPIICKDFILCDNQIYLARQSGADAVLLIAKILEDEKIERFYDVAKNLGMDVVLEIKDKSEAIRANALSVPIIGINNRNLEDFLVDIVKTKKLSSILDKNKIVISESGIKTKEDVIYLSEHCDAMLVGTSLLKSNNLAESFRIFI